jgi:hypothetical protein
MPGWGIVLLSIWVDHSNDKGTFSNVDGFARCTEAEGWRLGRIWIIIFLIAMAH